MERGAVVGALVSGIAAALISALVTIYVTSKTLEGQNTIARHQAHDEAVVAQTQARNAFVLAAAQYVMSQPNCRASLRKAAILRAIFPDRLGASFANPLTILLGHYRYDAHRHLYIPLPDPTGCTSRRPIHAKKPLPAAVIFGPNGIPSGNTFTLPITTTTTP